MSLDPISTLQNLVRIPSVNPMGSDNTGEQYYEHRLTEYLEKLFGELEIPCERHPVAPLRDNIIARVEGRTDGPVMLWEAHQDTVPVENMIIPPWDATLRDDRIWGRGACDIKGGMAAMLTALSRVAKLPKESRPTIVMACTVNEEHGFTGATALTRLWQSGESALLPSRPDIGIVAEPTDLQVVVTHKGVVRWKCQTNGVSFHSSSPERGKNAIYAMGRVLAGLEEYAQNIVSTLGNNPRLGTPTLSVGTIHGGISVNTVPDECLIEIDRRLLPGEQPLEAMSHVTQHLAEKIMSDDEVIHHEPFIIATGLAAGENEQLARSLVAVVQSLDIECETIGVAYGTDASAFSEAGLPTVVFGPGSVAQAHTKDEYLEVKQLKQAVECLYQFARAHPSGERSEPYQPDA